MESQRPPVPCSATSNKENYQPLPQLPPTAARDEYDCAYNEKDASQYQQQQSTHPGRRSKSSYRKGHDSVISHPFSPKASSPPSPGSSISSLGRQPNSITEIRYATPEAESTKIQYPKQVHIDPEKRSYRSSQGRRSPTRVSAAGYEGDAIVYDKGEYQEKGPEEKAWQLLVCITSITPSILFIH
jgi:hypothetical protein